MGDPLRDDTLQASFAMYDYGSYEKCLTECMKCRSRYCYVFEDIEVWSGGCQDL